MSAYQNDPRVSQVSERLHAINVADGTWYVQRDDLTWDIYDPTGELAVERYCDADEAIWAVIGDPQ